MNKVPNLRFNNFNDEWQEHVLGHIFEFYTTNSFSQDFLDNDNGSVKNIHYGDIHMKFPTLLDVKNTQIPYVKETVDLSKISIESYCKNGDVVIADASEDYNDIGKAIELQSIGEEKVIAGLHTILARDNKGIMVNGFRGYLMTSPNVRKQIKVYAAGAKVLGISKANISKVKLLIPSSMEQEKIASFFSLIDKKIELQTEKVEELKNYKKGIMQKMFPKKGETVPELRFAGFTNAWRQWKLSELLAPSSERNNEGKYTQADILAASLGTELVKKHIFFGLRSTEESVKTYRVVKPGNVIYTKSPIKGYPNGIVRTNKGLDGIVPSMYCVYHSIPSINSSIIQSYFEDKYRLNAYLYPLVNVGARNNVNITDLGFLEGTVCLPQDIDEQNKIVDFLNHLTHLITLHQYKLNALNEYKKGLLQQMFI